MIRVIRLVGLLGALVTGVLIGLPDGDPSNVQLIWGAWQVTASPLGALLGLLLVWIGAYAAVALLVMAAAVPGGLVSWHSGRRTRAVESALDRGLLRLAEGKYAESATLLERVARSANLSTSQRMTAAAGGAIAAHRVGDYRSLRRHVNRAVERSGEPLSALCRAAAARLEGEHEEATRVLTDCHKRDPANLEVALQLAEILAQSERWDDLESVMANLGRGPLSARLLRPLRVALAGAQVRRGLVPRELHAVWSKLAHEERSCRPLLAAYVRGMLGNPGALNEELTSHLEQVVRSALDEASSDELVDLYSRIPAPGSHRLARLEGWLAQRPKDAALLRAAGRVCVGEKLWGKARRFLRASADLAPCAHTCFELAMLERGLGDTAAASAWTERGVVAYLDPRGDVEHRAAASVRISQLPQGHA